MCLPPDDPMIVDLAPGCIYPLDDHMIDLAPGWIYPLDDQMIVEIQPRRYVGPMSNFVSKSDYFRRHFDATLQDQQPGRTPVIVIPNSSCHPDAFIIVAKFCMGTMKMHDITPANVVELFAASDVLELEELKRDALYFVDCDLAFLQWETCVQVLATFRLNAVPDFDCPPNMEEKIGITTLFRKCVEALLDSIATRSKFLPSWTPVCFVKQWVLIAQSLQPDIAKFVYESLLAQRFGLFYASDNDADDKESSMAEHPKPLCTPDNDIDENEEYSIDEEEFRIALENPYSRSLRRTICGRTSLPWQEDRQSVISSGLQPGCHPYTEKRFLRKRLFTTSDAYGNGKEDLLGWVADLRALLPDLRQRSVLVLYLAKLLHPSTDVTYVCFNFVCRLLVEATELRSSALPAEDWIQVGLDGEIGYLENFVGRHICLADGHVRSPSQLFEFEFKTLLSIVKHVNYLFLQGGLQYRSISSITKIIHLCLGRHLRENYFTAEQVLFIYLEFRNERRAISSGLRSSLSSAPFLQDLGQMLEYKELADSIVLDLFRSHTFGDDPPTQLMQRVYKLREKELIRLKKELEEEKKKAICLICYENPRNMICMPCGHLHFCLACLQRHQEGALNKTCPSCRGAIKDLLLCTERLV